MASIKPQLNQDERAARDMFARLARAADEFEGYAHPHAERVAALAEELALRLRLGRDDRASLRVAALAHDLGEESMRRDYIKHVGPLTREERLDLARHPVIGEHEAARAGADRGAQLLVRWHHEWWDGSSYPDALRGEQIPLPARVLRVADSYAALTDDRPFRRALTAEDARRHLADWAGLEFDPRVVRAFLSLTDVPGLRSYARPDASVETRPQTVAPDLDPESAAAGDSLPIAVVRQDGAAEDTNAERGLGGRVPEAGANPYASAATDGGRVGESHTADKDQF